MPVSLLPVPDPALAGSLSSLWERLRAEEALLAWAGWIGLALTIASLIVVPALVALMPSDYFAAEDPPPARWNLRHPLARLALRVARNLLGAALLALGLAMLVLPGQGLLTIVASLLLVEFKGKRRLELALVRRPRILAALSWIRVRLGRPPLDPPRSAPPRPPLAKDRGSGGS